MKRCECDKNFPDVKKGDVVKCSLRKGDKYYLVTHTRGKLQLHSLDGGNVWSDGSLWGGMWSILSPEEVSVVDVCYKVNE